MEGANVPVLAAAQLLTALGGGAVAPPAGAPAGDGFAAILRATDLTGLTGDQRAVLAQLLSDPVKALKPVADAGGKVLPQAAMRGLLEVLGFDSDIDAAEPRAGVAMSTELQSAKAGIGTDADGGADLAALLAMLLPAATPMGPQAPVTPPSAGGTDPGPVPETAHPAGQALSPSSGPLWQLLRHAGAIAESASPPDRSPAASPTLSAVPEAAGADLEMPAAFFAAAATAAGDTDAEAPAVGDLARGLAVAVDAAQSGGGRSAIVPGHDPVPPRAAALVSEAVSIPVGERGWERAFGERVVWLIGQQLQSAEVKLNPPHLGPVEVRLSLTGQDASVSFTVAHGATRDAIEQAIPRLRELFAEHQLQIVNVDVGQRDASSQASQGDRRGQGSSPSAGVGTSTSATGAESVASVQRGGLPGLVDEYV